MYGDKRLGSSPGKDYPLKIKFVQQHIFSVSCYVCGLLANNTNRPTELQTQGDFTYHCWRTGQCVYVCWVRRFLPVGLCHGL